MSEPATEAKPPPKGKGMPKKIAGVPTPVALGIGALVLTLGFLFLRKKSSPAAAAAGAACTDANGNQGTTDASGNCISTVTGTNSGIDQSGQPCQDQNGNPGISDALGNCVTTGGLSTAAGSGTSSGGDSGGGTGTVGTTGGTGTTGTTGTTPTTPTTGTGDVAAPGGLSLTPYATYADVAWTPNPAVTEWHYQVLPATGTTPVIDATTTGVHVKLSPLKAKTAYRFRVSSENPRGLWTAYHAFTTKAA